MSVDQFKFSVKCAWTPLDSKEPANVISLASARDSSQRSEEYEGEIRHEINQDNLIQFIRPSDDETPCTLTILAADSNWKISKISVVSEGRLVELYGPHGEYISTSRGTCLTDSPEICLYNSQVDINIRRELTIKFPGAKNSLRIYGVKLLVDQIDVVSRGTFDYERVDEMLQSSSKPITDTAEQAKQFLRQYSSMLNRTSSAKQPDGKTVLKNLHSEYKSHLKPEEDVGRNVAHTTRKSSGSDVLEMKAYVDQSMRQLEERVQNNLKIQLETMEEKQNQKLDTILQLLSNKS